MLEEIKTREEKIILFLDEFPDVIKNIQTNEGTRAAKNVLKTLRALRYDPNFNENFGLVLAGSIGLSHVVKNIDRRKVINDLHPVRLDPLSEKEALEFINFLTKDADLTIEEAVKKHILNKIHHYIPYYLQLIVERCDSITDDQNKTKLSEADVDIAYTDVLKSNENFKDWVDRLGDYYPDENYFFQQVLTSCAHQGKISIKEIFSHANHLTQPQDYKALIDDVLVRDGYLHEVDGYFIFNSPLLNAWWKNRYPIFEK